MGLVRIQVCLKINSIQEQCNISEYCMGNKVDDGNTKGLF